MQPLCASDRATSRCSATCNFTTSVRRGAGALLTAVNVPFENEAIHGVLEESSDEPIRWRCGIAAVDATDPQSWARLRLLDPCGLSSGS